MKRALFLDLETSGLNPARNQILEVAAVEYYNGLILRDQAFHCYVDHEYITYEFEALTKFGDRIRDRKPHVPVLKANVLAQKLGAWFHARKNWDGIGYQKPTVGGKNIGSFDLQFLIALHPSFKDVGKHRYIDLGNLYFQPSDDAIPTLTQCVQRAKTLGFDTPNDVTHTALDDTLVCAHLYKTWELTYVGPTKAKY